MLKTSLANLFLRGLTLGSKFFLLLFIARYLTPEELGVWGIVYITITMSLLVLGLDFYTFTTREILAGEPSQRARMLRDQMVFHGLVYLLVLPVLLGVFFLKFIAWKYIVWFYLLLVLEHIAQELYRLLVVLYRPTMANLVLFIRSGAWVILALGAGYYVDSLRQLTTFWAGWVMGVSLAIIISARAIRGMDWAGALASPVDWEWIKKGVKTALPFFLATLALIGIESSDRYFLQYFQGEAIVGAYTFYYGIANVIHVFILSGVIMILYPKIIESWQHGRLEEYRRTVNKMTGGIILGLAVMLPAAFFGIGILLTLVGKEFYSQHRGVFFIMLGTVSVMSLSYIPHYILYARGKDKAIVVSTILGLAVSLTANAVLIPAYSLKGAAWATLIAVTVMTLAKTVALYSDRNQVPAGYIDRVTPDSPELV